MANQQGNFLTAIDVGSAKTCALMAEVTDNGLRYRGHGVADSHGLAPVKKHPEYSEHEYFVTVEAAFTQWEAVQTGR